MNRRIRESFKQSKSLFARIFLRLTLPLLALAILVSFFLLSNELRSVELIYRSESRAVFQEARQILQEIGNSEVWVSSPSAALEKALAERSLLLDKNTFTIYNLFKNRLLVESPTSWDDADHHAAEQSIYAKEKEGLPYLLQAFPKRKILAGYFPLSSKKADDLVVARVTYPIRLFEDAVKRSRNLLLVLIGLILGTGIFIGISLTRTIVNPVKVLNHAVEEIRKGNLLQRIHLKTGDELEAMAHGINDMTVSLQAMQDQAQDSNPLSHLPGNFAIMKESRRRIASGQRFVFFHVDLDRFKIFNDAYGLAKGDEMIIKTSQLLKQVVSEKSPHDFVGHQGGDDFILMILEHHARVVAEEIIRRFDTEVLKTIYKKEDYENKYTLFIDRRGMQERGETEAKTVKFPLVAVSLAGVSNTKKDFADYQDVLQKSIQVKKRVKTKIESCYEISE